MGINFPGDGDLIKDGAQPRTLRIPTSFLNPTDAHEQLDEIIAAYDTALKDVRNDTGRTYYAEMLVYQKEIKRRVEKHIIRVIKNLIRDENISLKERLYPDSDAHNLATDNTWANHVNRYKHDCDVVRRNQQDAKLPPKLLYAKVKQYRKDQEDDWSQCFYRSPITIENKIPVKVTLSLRITQSKWERLKTIAQYFSMTRPNFIYDSLVYLSESDDYLPKLFHRYIAFKNYRGLAEKMPPNANPFNLLNIERYLPRPNQKDEYFKNRYETLPIDPIIYQTFRPQVLQRFRRMPKYRNERFQQILGIPYPKY